MPSNCFNFGPYFKDLGGLSSISNFASLLQEYEERVFLQREPENICDENSIAACIQSGVLFGHVIGLTARKLLSIFSMQDILPGFKWYSWEI